MKKDCFQESSGWPVNNSEANITLSVVALEQRLMRRFSSLQLHSPVLILCCSLQWWIFRVGVIKQEQGYLNEKEVDVLTPSDLCVSITATFYFIPSLPDLISQFHTSQR